MVYYVKYEFYHIDTHKSLEFEHGLIPIIGLLFQNENCPRCIDTNIIRIFHHRFFSSDNFTLTDDGIEGFLVRRDVIPGLSPKCLKLYAESGVIKFHHFP